MIIFGMETYEILEFFLIYSFLGWCLEVVYHAVSKGMIVNRGFLNGPVCPIYGFGVVSIFIMVHFLSTSKDGMLSQDIGQVSAFAIFLGGVVLSTLIELIGGFALDKIFHARWWDYSDKPFNLKGYICPEFSILWGIGILLIVRIVQPAMADATNSLIPRKYGWIAIAVFYCCLLADIIVSVLIMAGLNKRIRELDSAKKEMRKFSDGLTNVLAESSISTARHLDEARVQGALAEAQLRDDIHEKSSELRASADHRRQELEEEYKLRRSELIAKASAHRIMGTGRLLRAFPDMTHRDHPEILSALRDELKNHSTEAKSHKENQTEQRTESKRE